MTTAPRFASWIPGLACLVVLAAYAWLAALTDWPVDSPARGDNYYQLLADGFRAGQLHLRKAPPPALEALPDPYDPVANVRFRGTHGVHDMSLYRGKLYLYFGVTPALALFLPASLLGLPLSEGWAIAIFCSIGFGAMAWTLCRVREKFFPAIGAVMTGSGLLVLGLAGGMPLLLARPHVYEVALSCGHAMAMLSLAAVWGAIERPVQRAWWIAAASLMYGLALGARAALLFGAAILLVPLVVEWKARGMTGSRRIAWFAAAVAPIAFVGFALLLYNHLRFDSPLQFGEGYVLGGVKPLSAKQTFSWSYVGFNLRVYFWEPMQWSGRFPFVLGEKSWAVPAGYTAIDGPFGVLLTVPVVWFAALAPLAARPRTGDDDRRAVKALGWAAALLFGMCALTLAFFWGANGRYETEFLPALVFLATLGFWGVERTLAKRRAARMLARVAWGSAALFSIAFNVLIGCDPAAPVQSNIGYALLEKGRVPEAITRLRLATWCQPGFAEAHCNLGTALHEAGRVNEALPEFAEAVRLRPNFVVARNNLAFALLQAGRLSEAKIQFEQVLRYQPGAVDARRALEQIEEKLRRAGSP